MRIEIVIAVALFLCAAYLIFGSYLFRRNLARVAGYAGFDMMSLFMGTMPTMGSLRLGLERELTRLSRVQQNLSWGLGASKMDHVGESYVQQLLEDFVDKRFQGADYSGEERGIREIANFADDLASYYGKSEEAGHKIIECRLRAFAKDLDLWREAVHWFASQPWNDPVPTIARNR